MATPNIWSASNSTGSTDMGIWGSPDPDTELQRDPAKKTSQKKKINGKKIDDFKSNMTSFARPNLFEVVIHPLGGSTEDSPINRKLSFSCHSCSLPGASIATTEKDAPQAAYRSIAYQRMYEDVSMSFYVSGDMKEIEVFQNWMKLMVDPTNNRVGYHKSYASTNIEIKNLDQNQRKVLTTTLFEAYPKTLAAVDLSYGTNDEVMSISVTFTYRYYEQVFGDKETIGENLEKNIKAIKVPTAAAEINSVLDKTKVLVPEGSIDRDAFLEQTSGSARQGFAG